MARIGRGIPNRPIITRSLPGMADVVVTEDVGVVSIAGFTPVVVVEVDESLGVVSIAGYAPSTLVVEAEGVGVVSIAGFTPSLVVEVDEGVGAVSIAGFAPTVPDVEPEGPGVVSIAGFTPSLIVEVDEGLGVVSIAGFVPSVALVVGPGVGSVSVAGFGPGGVVVITEGVGVVSILGYTPSVVRAVPVVATGGIIYDGSVTPTATVAVGACSGGILYGGSVVPQGETIIGTPLVRWRFDDPVDASAYLFEINPNAGGSAKANQLLTVVPTTAADGAPLIFAGDTDLLSSQFSGVLRSQAQHDAFKTWFDKNRPVQLTDDLGRRSIVNLVKFDPKRASRARSPFRQSYTVDYQILALLDV